MNLRYNYITNNIFLKKFVYNIFYILEIYMNKVKKESLYFAKMFLKI